jgi:hypothetical protein
VTVMPDLGSIMDCHHCHQRICQQTACKAAGNLVGQGKDVGLSAPA